MKKKSVFVILSSVSIILVIFVLLVGYNSPNKYDTKGSQKLSTANSDWEISWGNKKILCDVPNRISNYKCKPIEMKKVMHATEKAECIMFYTVQSETEVWVDDSLIYDFETKNNTKWKTYPPSMYHIVEIPKEKKDYVLKIRIKPTFGHAAGDLPEVYYDDEKNLSLFIMGKAIPTVVLVVILFALAIYNLIYSIASEYSEKGIRRRMRNFSWLAISMCVWCFLEIPIKQFIYPKYDFTTAMLEVAYFAVPIFLSRYFLAFEEIGRNKLNIVVSYVTYVQFLVVQVAVLCGVQSIRLNILMQISVALVLSSVMICVIRSKPGSEIRSLAKQFSWLCAGLILEALRFFFFTRMGSGIIMMLFLIVFAVWYSIFAMRRGREKYAAIVKKNYEIQASLEKAQVELMLAQISPHFLYNALTSIQTIIKVNPDYAYELMFDFSRYLRSSINSITSKEFISFTDEIKNIEAYLNIEKMRLGEKLKVTYDIRCKDFDILPLSIQPIVENSIKHGYGRKHETLELEIISYEDKDSYNIVVKDTGKGFDVNKLNEKEDSIGVANIKFRMEKQMNARIEMESDKTKGTVITVVIPKEKDEKRNQ